MMNTGVENILHEVRKAIVGKDIGAYDGSGGAYGESSGNYYREW